jgi:hypothetical protein
MSRRTAIRSTRKRVYRYFISVLEVEADRRLQLPLRRLELVQPDLYPVFFQAVRTSPNHDSQSELESEIDLVAPSLTSFIHPPARRSSCLDTEPIAEHG